MPIDLVTGATGLVGGNLVHTLNSNGRQVRILHRKGSNTAVLDDVPGLELVEGDIRNLPSLVVASEGVEDVYHCAALVSMWNGMADLMWQVNVTGTRNVIQAVVTNDARRLIYCSSVDAIGLPESDQPSDEGTVWNWDRLGVENPYARTKLEAQKLVLEASRNLLDAVVVNPTYMFGAYDQRPSSGQMILEIAAGGLLAYPTGGNNFVDVKDVTEAMVEAARKGICGECYILGNENVAYQEMMTRIALILNVTPPRARLPYPIARFGGWIGDMVGGLTAKEQSVTSNTARMGYVDHYYNPGKAVRELGMKQSPVDEAVRRAIRWFRNEEMLPAGRGKQQR